MLFTYFLGAPRGGFLSVHRLLRRERLRIVVSEQRLHLDLRCRSIALHRRLKNLNFEKNDKNLLSLVHNYKSLVFYFLCCIVSIGNAVLKNIHTSNTIASTSYKGNLLNDVQ